MNTFVNSIKWYRQPLVWMLIAIPLSAVLGGISMIYLAITTDDGLVNDDYYRYGKQINLVLERDIEARRLGLHAQLDFNPQTGTVAVHLDGDKTALPANITLSLLHATRANHDQHIKLVLTPNQNYHGLIEQLIPGKWYVQLHTQQWRLSSKLQYPGQTRLDLTAK